MSLANADCNGNGIPDSVDLKQGTSDDCDSNGTPDECDVTPLGFDLARFVLPGTTARSIATGDFDSDGLVDLCAAVPTEEGDGNATITVLLNRNGMPLSRADHDVGSLPHELATGDFDGSGQLDLVGLGAQSLWLLSNTGEGDLTSPVEFTLNRATSSLAVADFDGDGRDDVVVGGSSESLETDVDFFWGTADGLTDTPTKVAVGDSAICCSLVAEDFDGDGQIDIAISHQASDKISLLLNRGGRTFEPSPATLNWTSPSDLVTNDFNGDAVPDILVVGNGSLGVFVNDGDAGFTPAPPFGTNDGDGAIATGDFDGDGDTDVTIAGSPLTVVVNDGTGTFQAALTLDVETTPNVIEAIDFDNNGEMDLAAVVFDGLEILSRRVGAPPVSLVKMEIPTAGHWGALGDLDGDLSPDIVVADSHRFKYLKGQGQAPPLRGHSFRQGGRVDRIATADLDGDGDLDVASTDGPRLFRWVNNGAGRLEKRTEVLQKPSSSLAIADFNNDGAAEIVTVDFSDGKIALTFDRRGGQRLTVDGGPRAAAGGDFDGDGHIDLAVARETISLVTILQNGGNGRLKEGASFPVDSCSFVTAVDLDGDADTDLLTTNSATQSLSLLLNDGDGSFELLRTVWVGRALTTAYVVDFNTDGIPDIVGVSSHGTATILLGLGGGALDSPYHFPAARGSDSGAWLGVTDMEGDGDPDLVAIGEEKSHIFFSEPGDGPEFLEKVCTEQSFHQISIAVPGDGPEKRATKFIVPARADDPSLIPPLFQNVRRHLLHQDFLQDVFAKKFPGGLDFETFDRLVNRRETRDYFVGVLTLLETDDGPIYGFSVLVGFDQLDELPTLDDVRHVHNSLKAIFSLEPLVYVPPTLETKESASKWNNPGFRIYFDDRSLSFESYTRGIGYGRVRLLDEEAFREANESGDLSFQDILILARAPRDIEGVFGGVATAEPQGALSHLAIRTARRKTPNAFVRDALEKFAPFEGKLVRIEVTDADYSVVEVNDKEAAVWWEQNRVELSVTPTVDPNFDALPSLLEIDLGRAELPPESRFGGKATNFARLQQLVLTGDWSRYREAGFSIPAHYYLEFLRSNSMPSAVDATREVTYEEYIRELGENPEFKTSSRARFEALDALRDHMRDDGQVDQELVDRLANRIREVFGGVDFRVRFRSSSNIEDALEFNGAGLYDSTSVCAADYFDDDDVGPSVCDPTRENERGVERGLKRVWRSLWNFRAYEERAFYGIDQTLSAMALLVNKAFVDEQVNGVAFTGNPFNPLDTRYVISAQVGEESVVSPEPGTLAEKNIVEVADGKVISIIRAARSTLVEEGEFVLSNDQLEELGALLWHIDQNFPIELGDHDRREVLLDLEFKIEANGRLAVKQVRPFLLSEPPPAPPPTFRLEIPPDAVACDTFITGRSARSTYLLKSTVHFLPGVLEIPTLRDTFSGELFEEVRIGRNEAPAQSRGPGLFTIRQSRQGPITEYNIKFEQTFTTPAGKRLELRLSGLTLSAEGDKPLVDTYTFNDALLSKTPLVGNHSGKFIRYESCTFSKYPQTEIRLNLGGGSRLLIVERTGPTEAVTWIAPTRLVLAELEIQDVSVQVTRPQNLIYAATRHHHEITNWIVLEPPFAAPGVARPIHVIEFVDTTRPRGRGPGTRRSISYLDTSLRRIAQPRVISSDYKTGVPFRRGDSNSDGKINIGDPLHILGYSFRDGDTPTCLRAADVNADGAITITDPVSLLRHLFSGAAPPPPPFERCGLDLTPERRSCDSYGPCAGQ